MVAKGVVPCDTMEVSSLSWLVFGSPFLLHHRSGQFPQFGLSMLIAWFSQGKLTSREMPNLRAGNDLMFPIAQGHGTLLSALHGAFGACANQTVGFYLGLQHGPRDIGLRGLPLGLVLSPFTPPPERLPRNDHRRFPRALPELGRGKLSEGEGPNVTAHWLTRLS